MKRNLDFEVTDGFTVVFWIIAGLILFGLGYLAYLLFKIIFLVLQLVEQCEKVMNQIAAI
jgi:hypothetical protein